ncbi:MAG: NAD(P)/FAD-dependent oxidoreductase [bacterium]
MAAHNANSYDADVLVLGAGPCGAFLANLLGKRGLSCVVVEKRLDIPTASMAIGLMPPSLRRLDDLNLADRVVQEGCPVRRVRVLNEKAELGALDLASLPPPFNFVLSVPQGDVIRLLRDRLTEWPRARLVLGCEVRGVTQDERGVTVHTRDLGSGTPGTLGARFAVACDGAHSPARGYLGLPFEGKHYAPSFVMGDFPDATSWAGEARLVFTPTGSIESFPLPRGRRRWVVQAECETPDAAVIARRVKAVTGMFLDPGAAEGVTRFTPERRLSGGYFKGRVVLCGDAAHVMSPIGGQGMNTGLADAWHLASVLCHLCATGEPPGPWLTQYEWCRRRAFGVAADRAARGMWLGTLKGPMAAALRSLFIRDILLGPFLRDRLAPHFAMLTIPDEDPMGQGPPPHPSEP